MVCYLSDAERSPKLSSHEIDFRNPFQKWVSGTVKLSGKLVKNRQLNFGELMDEVPGGRVQLSVNLV
jgi:hypothetical protein